jgi:hypothetical protein
LNSPARASCKLRDPVSSQSTCCSTRVLALSEGPGAECLISWAAMAGTASAQVRAAHTSQSQADGLGHLHAQTHRQGSGQEQAGSVDMGRDLTQPGLQTLHSFARSSGRSIVGALHGSSPCEGSAHVGAPPVGAPPRRDWASKQAQRPNQGRIAARAQLLHHPNPAWSSNLAFIGKVFWVSIVKNSA